jgi:transcriptional regulator with XRE-family HTH domain
MSVSVTIGKRIKNARCAYSYTQSQLANVIGMHVTSLRRWESNKHVPDADMLLRVAKALDTSVAYLVNETDDPRRHSSQEELSEKRGIARRKLANASSDRPDGRFASVVDRITLSKTGAADKVILIPIYSTSVCMEKDFDDKGEPHELIDTLYLKASDIGKLYPEKPFGFEVHCDSMAPRIESGVYVVVNPNIPPGRGDICLVRFREKGFLLDSLKYYHRSGKEHIFKDSETSGAPPIVITQQDIDEGDAVIVGRVVYIDRGERI